jgi:prophage antirepressor-like protein
LDLGHVTNTLARLDKDECNTITLTDTIGRKQEVRIINESGLYSLILTSRKPEAKKFKKWVTSEVLPSIRKTGSYVAPKVNTVPQTNL